MSSAQEILEESALLIYEELLYPEIDWLFTREECGDLAVAADARKWVRDTVRQVVYYLDTPGCGNRIRLVAALDECGRIADVRFEVAYGDSVWVTVPREDWSQTEAFAGLIGCYAT